MSYPYLDMHCDTLMHAFQKKIEDIYTTDSMLDVARLKAAGCKAQFFAIFMTPITAQEKLGPLFPNDDIYIHSCLHTFRNTMKQHGDVLAMARNFPELEENWAAGKVSGILTLEDGRAVQGSIGKLEGFYREGIRLISLTWNHENCFGAPNSTDPALMAKGLADFGKDAVVRMAELGMLVDVSHLSDGGFWDVARLVKGPFVASHSNCRALNPHPRSMTDEMIRTLADHGGVMGLNFSPSFLESDIANTTSRISAMVRQLQHMKQIGGADIVGIGTDLDGIRGQFEVKDPLDMPLLFQAMEKAGFTETEMEKATHLNVERVIREAMK